MTRRVAFLDVFAERPLAGNGLAVVDDADGVPEEVMLSFARETRLSETTFVQTAGKEGADYRNRIFTVKAEIPFAGHPSLGTAVAVARWRGLEEASLVQETEAGLQPIEVRSNRGWHASMLQNEAEFGAEPDSGATMRAVGLSPDDAHPELPPQIVSTGLPTVIVPVSDPSALARPEPDFDAIDELLGPINDFRGADETPTFYLVWCEPEPWTSAGANVLARRSGRRGPGDRLGGRSPLRLSRRAHRVRAPDDLPGRGDGPAERARDRDGGGPPPGGRQRRPPDRGNRGAARRLRVGRARPKIPPITAFPRQGTGGKIVGRRGEKRFRQ